jgi:hypothetical protein
MKVDIFSEGPRHELVKASAAQQRQILHDLKIGLKTASAGYSVASLMTAIDVPLPKAIDALEFAEQAIAIVER